MFNSHKAFVMIRMSEVGEGKEYFLRLEAYFHKGLRNYWPILSELFKEVSKHVYTVFNTEVYEDFNMVLFHEEELESFIHASIHFSRIRKLPMVDSIVDKVLEISEFVEAYLSIKNDALLKNMDENIYVEGVNVRILKYGDKGFYTLSFRLFKQNRGIRLVQKIFYKTSKRKVIGRFKRVFRLGRR